MADELDKSDNPKTAIAQDAGNPSPPSDSPKPKKGFRLPNLKPNFRLPKLGLGKPKSPPKARNFLWLWLLIILTWRGVKEPETKMVNSIVRGVFRQNPYMKKEFFDLIRAHGFGD